MEVLLREKAEIETLLMSLPKPRSISVKALGERYPGIFGNPDDI